MQWGGEVRMEEASLELASQAFDSLKRAAVLPARIRLVLRTGDGLYLYARKEPTSARWLTEQELAREEPVMAAVLARRPEIGSVIRSLPDYAGDAVRIRRFASFSPALVDAAEQIGCRIRLVAGDHPRRILRCLKKKDACIVRPTLKRDETEPYVLALGATPAEAAAITLILEKACQVLINGALLGGAKRLKPWAAFWLRRRFLRRKEIPPARPLNHQGKREELCEAVNQLLQLNYLQTPSASVSLRLDGDSFLVAAPGSVVGPLSPSGTILVRAGIPADQKGGSAAFGVRLHAALMKRFPHINCAMITTAASSSVFAACRQPVILCGPSCRNEDETAYAGHRLGEIVRALDFGESGICILGHRGALVTATSLEGGLERCALLERSANLHLNQLARELRG